MFIKFDSSVVASDDLMVNKGMIGKYGILDNFSIGLEQVGV